MDPKDILRKIIEEEGDCRWANLGVCSNCPLGKYKTKLNGDFLTCAEALYADGMNLDEANERYKDTAEKVLQEMEIEEILLGDDDAEDNT